MRTHSISIPRVSFRSGLARAVTSVALVATLALLLAPDAAASPSAAVANGCVLPGNGGAIQHVIYLQFDNVHLVRDNPNVPSDLEQMPHLLHFLEANGSLLSNEHTPLISHTADDIVTSETGVYGDQHGVPIANTFLYFNPDGSSTVAGSFAYWGDPIVPYAPGSPTDPTTTMIDSAGKNAPAPWVPYTRAGCNVGVAAAANMELENTSPDIALVYGANSPQAQEARTLPTKATADFMGISVHCAQGNSVCSTANGGVPDVLLNEPLGYTNYNALYGHRYVAPQISPNQPFTDLHGNAINGFPGYGGMTPDVTLSYVLDMQEHGIPVTYAYIRDAHEQLATGNPYGPGEAGYVRNLQSFDQSFNTFFNRLAADGITPSNTLFVVTADEGDHFVGGPPSPVNCDGVQIPCTYAHIGELDAQVNGLLATQQQVTTTFGLNSDMAPAFYLQGDPAQTDPTARAFERALAKLGVDNLLTGQNELLANQLADQTELKLLHMITGDARRSPTAVMFAKPDYWIVSGSTNCSSPCVTEYPYDAWNHGGVAPEINTTWLGVVGPGVQQLGRDSNVWSDHSNIRSTMLTLHGLTDDYSHAGRLLAEILTPAALPPPVGSQEDLFVRLATTYQQINAPVGPLGLDTLTVSTKALASGNASDDATYTRLEAQLTAMTVERNQLTAQMSAILEGAEFSNQSIDVGQANQLIGEAQALLRDASTLAAQ